MINFLVGQLRKTRALRALIYEMRAARWTSTRCWLRGSCCAGVACDACCSSWWACAVVAAGAAALRGFSICFCDWALICFYFCCGECSWICFCSCFVFASWGSFSAAIADAAGPGPFGMEAMSPWRVYSFAAVAGKRIRDWKHCWTGSGHSDCDSCSDGGSCGGASWKLVRLWAPPGRRRHRREEQGLE